MKSGGLYKIWCEKYGSEEADKRMKAYREKMRKATTGEKNGFFGKKHAKETRAKNAEMQRGKVAWNSGKKCPQFSGNRNPAKRPDVRLKISESVKASYTDELREVRSKHFSDLRTKTADSFRETMEAQGLWTPIEQKKQFDVFRSRVRALTQKTYSQHIDEIDPNRIRSRKYHLDHIVSIYDGFRFGVEPEVLAHVCNLRIVKHALNEQKFNTSGMTVDELKHKIKEYEVARTTSKAR